MSPFRTALAAAFLPVAAQAHPGHGDTPHIEPAILILALAAGAAWLLVGWYRGRS